MVLTLLLASFLTFVELNCENLFDCQHDSLKNDTEFLPDAPRHWTSYKYWRKINHLSKEIMACGGDSSGAQPPDLVALCEVENDSVVRDLAHRSALHNAGYDYLVTSSPDIRGIDVALLYHRYSFLPLVRRDIRVEPLKGMRPTRDILYVAGQTTTGDTLHVFVLHAPSRLGGARSTQPYRDAVAHQLCTAVDSIRALSPEANIIVAGDFNEGGGKGDLVVYRSHALLDATAEANGRNGAKGTYRYKGRWEHIDHILVSPTLQPRVVSAFIFDAAYLLTDDQTYGGVKPRRTYPSYSYDPEGYSDHLPLVVRFQF